VGRSTGSGDLEEAAARAACIAKFKEWWTRDELSQILSQINPGVIQIFADHGEKISTHGRLAEVVYDIVGPRFLRNIENSPQKRRLFLELMLQTVSSKKIVPDEAVLEAVRASSPQRKKASSIEEIAALDMSNRLCLALAAVLGLPPSVAEKEHAEQLPSTEAVEPYTPLNPLYDYQHSTGLLIRGMLDGTATEDGRPVKRKLIAVPTGSGKTRMTVEALVNWFNDGKPSEDPQQRDSKFVLWVAQSHELCEQAFSTFRTVFESRGRRGTTLRLHRFWGPGGELPQMGMEELLDEKGVIVATIQSLYKIYAGERAQLARLAALTSCVIVDEAHHVTADSYSAVLREMGFNWDNRKKEISEKGIVLLGLTATPFRGAGSGAETERLARRLNGVHFPAIATPPEFNNFSPRAVIDCQMRASVGEDVMMMGDRSYDRDGFIGEDGYLWTIVRQRKGKEVGEPVEYRSKNVTHRFDEPGSYRITLAITDNDGDTDSAEAPITVNEARVYDVPPERMQKDLFAKLVRRKILCDVHHKVLPSRDIELSAQETRHVERFGEFARDTLKSIGQNYERNRIMLDNVRQLCEEGGRKKVLFFACSVEHSRQMSMFLRTLYGMRAGYVDSKIDMDTRVKTVEMFRSGDLEVLCNYDVLTAGFDAPNVDCVFVGRPVKSTLLYTQMIGRGMRGTKSGGTENMLIVDMDDNFQLHGTTDASVKEMGWKVFREYWKPWKPQKEAEWVGPAEAEPAPQVSEEKMRAYACAECGASCADLESVKETFGIYGADQFLAECIESGDHSELPRKCKECR